MSGNPNGSYHVMISKDAPDYFVDILCSWTARKLVVKLNGRRVKLVEQNGDPYNDADDPTVTVLPWDGSAAEVEHIPIYSPGGASLNIHHLELL